MADEKRIDINVGGNAKKEINDIASSAAKANKAQAQSLKELAAAEKQLADAMKKRREIEKESNTLISEAKKKINNLPEGGERRAQERNLRDEQQAFSYFTKKSDKEIDALNELVKVNRLTYNSAKKAESVASREENWKAQYEKKRIAKSEALANPRQVIKEWNQLQKEGVGERSKEEVETLDYKYQIAKTQKDPNLFRTIVGAVMATESIRQITGGIKGMINSQNGEQGLAQIASGAGSGMLGLGIANANPLLAAVGAVTDLVGGVFGTTASAQESATRRINAMTAISGKSPKVNGATSMGYSVEESLALQQGLMTANRSAEGVDTLTTQAQRMQRGLGIPEATLIALVKDASTIRTSTDLTSIVGKTIRANPELLKDHTKLNEILQAQMALTGSIAQTSEVVNRGQVVNEFGALRSLKGSWGDPALGLKNTQALQQGLSNPGNDFTRASMYEALSGMGMKNLLDMDMAIEGGISTPHLLSSVLKQNVNRYGKDNVTQGTLALRALFPGLSTGAAKTLFKKAAIDPKFLDKYEANGGKMTEDEITKNLLSQGTAESLTTKNQVQEASGKDAALNSVVDYGWTKIANVFTTAVDRMVNSNEKLGKVLEKKYNSTYIK